MSYDFKLLKQRLLEIEDWLKKELSSLRTGRANIALLDGVLVESYGSRMPVNQVASISLEDPKSIRITPWDTALNKEIEKSLTLADLGVSVVSDGKGVRVIFPELTSERREILIRQARKKLEEAKISLRKERESVWNDIQSKEKEGQISEDDKFRSKDEMQKVIDESHKKLEEITSNKEKEITN